MQRFQKIALAITITFAVFVVASTFYLAHFKRSLTNSALKISTTSPNDNSQNLQDSVAKGFTLIVGDKNLSVPRQETAKWLESYYRFFHLKQEYRPNLEAIVTYLKSISGNFDTDPVNARFEFKEGRLVEIKSAMDGSQMDIQETAQDISLAMFRGDSSSRMISMSLKANITSERVNELGITDLLGKGQSNFAGSPDFRIHNIKVGAAIFNGRIVVIGEEFSFNKILGDVDASGGYLPELVIKGDKIIPEYGGGLCQVSTTLFRAAINSGLPILERHAHSLPVRYYNPQGFDATIYPGSADLRFRNDTNSDILIQTEINGAEISFEIYGKNDGRRVALTGPTQYDVSPDGSLKAILRRTVILADSQKRKDSFGSSYKSPSLFTTIRNPLE